MPHVLKMMTGTDMRPVPFHAPAKYLRYFDVDTDEGRGSAEWTEDINEAMTFDSTIEAWHVWRTQSETVPFRPDGEPNRPLTAYSVQIMPIPE